MNKKIKWGLVTFIGLGLIGWGIYSQRPKLNEELEAADNSPAQLATKRYSTSTARLSSRSP